MTDLFGRDHAMLGGEGTHLLGERVVRRSSATVQQQQRTAMAARHIVDGVAVDRQPMAF